MSKEKKNKKKGPIRLEAVIPALVIFLLIYGYFFFFFDGHVRRAAEYVLTQVHGAEVNIGSFNTSFLNASMSIQSIQITDKNRPERDLFRVGEIKFTALWDGLLRAKIVIDEASISNIEALVPRKHPGRVLPPAPPSEDSVLANAQREIINQTRSRLQDNFLGDLAALLSGVDPKDQLKTIEGELKASLRIKELEAELKSKTELWEQRLKDLPESSYFKDLEKRFHAINWNEKDPLKFANNLNSANNLIKEAKEKVKDIDRAQQDLRGDVQVYGGSITELESFIEQDLKDLQNRLKIPSLDPKDITEQFFMKQIEERLVSVRKYYEVAKEYMPPKRTAEEKEQRKQEALVPRKRGDGENFSFPITTGYPKFWLKKAHISSTVSASAEYSGNITGEILDVNSHPQYLKRPTQINISGDFPKQKILGLDLKAVIDHTTDIPKQTLNLALNSFPMEPLQLSDSPDVKLLINDSVGALQVAASLSEGQISLDTKSQYNSLNYEIEAKEKVVQEILSSVFEGISQITLNAKVQGPWNKLRFNLNSNLGQELAQGFGKQLQLKIDQAKAQIRQQIDQEVGLQKEKLQAQITGLSANLEKSLGVKRSEVDKVIRDIEAGIKKEEGNIIKKDDLKKIEEEGKKLLKGLGL